MLDYREFHRIFNQRYDPRNPLGKLFDRDHTRRVRFHFGFVENNQDPDKKGRVKVRFPQWGNSIVSQWVPVLRPYSGTSMGMFFLPEVDEMVVCTFINDNPGHPIVIGSIYHKKNPPPISDVKGNNIKKFKSRAGSEIILDDTQGEEKITITSKDGNMRVVLDKNKGISIVNEVGDIKIKCKKLTIEAGDDTQFKFSKGLSIKTDQDKISIKANKGITIKSGGNVTCKGSQIKLKGSPGVTAANKQIATRDCQVVGIDMHDIQVPSQSGLVTVPSIPHPYLGKLADKLSQDVFVNDKSAATKDSKSKFSTPGHIAMPPGVKFTKQPSNDGVVSSGTVSTVKVNGKEVAVLGSMVKTCNDPTDQETCTVIAIGGAAVLPIAMPGMDPDEVKRLGGTLFNTRDLFQPLRNDRIIGPCSITSVKWSSSKAVLGEEVTLTAQLQNQYENATVYFSIYPEGADREKDPPLAKVSAPNKGGTAEAKWRYLIDDFQFEASQSDTVDYYEEKLNLDLDPLLKKHLLDDYDSTFDNPVKQTAKFFFIAKSFKCEPKTSSSIEVGGDIKISVLDEFGNPMKNVNYKIKYADGSESSGTTGEDGKIEQKSKIPGRYNIELEDKNK